MNCFACDERMALVLNKKSEYFRHEWLECPVCKSSASVFQNPDTGVTEEVHWKKGLHVGKKVSPVL